MPTAPTDPTTDWPELLDRPDVLILDSETTRLGENGEIVEIAIIDTTGEAVLDRLVLPVGRIAAGAARVHGITRDMLRAADAHPWRACESRPRHRPEHGQADSARPRDRTGSRAGPTNAVEDVPTGALGRLGRLRTASHLIHDRDPLYTRVFGEILTVCGVQHERNHQSRDNQLLQRPPPPVNPDTDVERRERLGGLLSFYYREAARGGS